MSIFRYWPRDYRPWGRFGHADLPNFSIQADPVLTEYIYKELKERKQGPMISFRYCWVSVTLGSVIAKFDCTMFRNICDGRLDQPTRQGVVACPQQKTKTCKNSPIELIFS